MQHVATSRPSAVRTASRLMRWRELNEICDKSKKSRTTSSSEDSDNESSEAMKMTASESSDVYRVFERYKGSYIQSRKPVPDDVIDDLAKYLTMASKSMGGFLATSVGVQRCMIGPALMTLCNLFDDMTVDLEETVDGNQVHAQGQLEYVFKRGMKTAKCVAHAKRGDFTQAIAQALIGCEVIAEREGQHVVYGVVTDFVTWLVFRSGEKSIMPDGRTLGMSSRELEMASLRDVCEMIYGALANHDEEDMKDQQLAMDETNA